MHMMLAGFLPLEFSGPIELRGGATAEAGLVTVPLFHATGLFSGFLVPCAVGQKVVLLRKWDAVTAMQINPEREGHDDRDRAGDPQGPAYSSQIRRLRPLVRLAGRRGRSRHPAGLPELLRDRLGIKNRSAGYGMTETASVCATMSGPVFDLKPMAAGILSPIIDLRVSTPQATSCRPARTARYSCGASPSPPGTGNATTSPKKRSPPTAGFAPATSATSTGWLPAHHRADQGNRHPRRREHRPHRDRERRLPTSLGQGGRGLRRPRRRHG